ncbi:MAG: PAS domain S-box protein, partial [Nocardioides sp.]
GAALTTLTVGSGSELEVARTVFASHAASTLVMVPVALTLFRGLPRNRLAELAAQTVALGGITVLVCGPGQALPLAFAPLPLLVWAALRFDVQVVTWQLLGVSVLCTAFTAQGFGPFAESLASGETTAVGAGALVQVWLLSAALMSLPLTVTAEQRRQLLLEVTAREQVFRRNFTESLMGMLLLRQHGDRLEIVDANDAAVQILGDGDRPLVGRHLDRVLTRTTALRKMVAPLVSGEIDGWRGQVGLRRRPEKMVHVSVSLISGGAESVFAAQVLDVTDRARIEAAEKLTSATLDTTACIIMVADMEGTLVRVNAATTSLTGFPAEALLGRPVWERLAVPHRRPVVEVMFSAEDGSALMSGHESDVATAGGDFLRVVWNNRVVHDEAGHPAYVVMTGIDVTAERHAAGLVDHLLRASITTALIGIDSSGRITLFSSGAQRLLGHSSEDVVGTPFVDILDGAELADRTSRTAEPSTFAALTGTIPPGGESSPRDWTWIGTDGRRHTVSMTLSIASQQQSGRSGYLCVGRDVTEQRHSQSMLAGALQTERTAVERLRKLDHAKNEFVSTVSHELRTPVTSIIGYTELLREGSVVAPDEGQVPMLDTIARNGERLITICNNLLLLGGLDSGAVTVERAELDLGKTMDATEDALSPMLTGRDLAVRFEKPDHPVIVLGDSIQLERVLLNLASNAVKFTLDGGTITCTLGVEDAHAVLRVADTGIGIPDDEQEGLFQKFFRTSTAQKRAIQGTGLGLSIVSGIVAAHDGTVDVESKHLHGSTFTVRLPRALTESVAETG